MHLARFAIVLAIVLALAALMGGCQARSTAARIERQPLEPQLVARDSSGMGNHGLNHGPIMLGEPGRVGTAYLFTEAGAWIEVPSAPELNPEGADFLVTVWIKVGSPPPNGGTRDLFRKGAHKTPGGDLKMEIVDDGFIKCTVIGGEKGYATMEGPPVKVADGTWHEVGCALTSDRLTVLVDGEWRSKLTRIDPISNNVPVAIGSKYGVEDPTSGVIDEVGYYIAQPARNHGHDLSLTAQLEHLRKPEHLRGLWHLDEEGFVANPTS
jgi:hypothetical protein